MTEVIQARKRESMTRPVALAALLTEKDLAAIAQVSAGMLQKLRREGRGPTYVRIGSAIRYPLAAVTEWLSTLHARS